MDDQQIQDIADRVIEALQNLAPEAPFSLAGIAAFTPVAALIAAVVAAVVGWRNLKQQQAALEQSKENAGDSLNQKREADARSEWWRRTQWALAAAASQDNTTMYGYGAGMLDLLAKSDLADTEDKALLDAVWEGSSTAMRDAGIEQLISDARSQGPLTEEEEASLRSFDELDTGAVAGEATPVDQSEHGYLAALVDLADRNSESGFEHDLVERFLAQRSLTPEETKSLRKLIQAMDDELSAGDNGRNQEDEND